MLLLAERHPDWSVNFIEGIEPGWWHESEEGSGVPISSLLPPEAWQQVLIDEGFADCDVFSSLPPKDLQRAPTCFSPSARWRVSSPCPRRRRLCGCCWQTKPRGRWRTTYACVSNPLDSTSL